jgi:hypothetical protein
MITTTRTKNELDVGRILNRQKMLILIVDDDAFNLMTLE